MINNILKYSLIASTLLGSFAYAGNSSTANTSNSANISNSSTTASSSNTSNDSNIADTSESTFGHLETLDRNIEAAGKEIKALQMENKLKNLKKEAQKMQTDFKVTRIYGVQNHLMASLLFENNTVVDVQAGDKIDDRYNVDKVTPKQVILYDQKNKTNLNAPFNKE